MHLLQKANLRVQRQHADGDIADVLREDGRLEFSKGVAEKRAQAAALDTRLHVDAAAVGRARRRVLHAGQVGQSGVQVDKLRQRGSAARGITRGPDNHGAVSRRLCRDVRQGCPNTGSGEQPRW